MQKEYFKKLFHESLTFNIYTKIYTFLLSAPLIKYFFNPYKLTPLWHSSFIFKIFELIMKKLFLPLADKIYGIISPIFSRINFFENNFYEHITGILIMLSAVFTGYAALFLAFAAVIWGGIFIYKNKDRLFAVSYTAVLSVFLIFYAVYNFIFGQEGILAIELLTPFLLFITASFSLNEKSDLETINSYALISLIILSGIIIISQGIKSINQNNIMYYANIVTVLMPLSLSKAVTEKSRLRRIFMTLTVLMLSITAVILSGSVSLYTAYSVSFLIFVTLTKPKFLLYILLISPAVIKLAANYLIDFLDSNIKYRTPAENIINISRELWQHSLSEGSAPFINAYTSFTSKTINSHIPYINESYIKILNISGLILLIIFLWFVLKSIRSCIVTFFKSHGTSKIQSAAVISFLTASSITAFISSNRLNFAVNSLYFLTLAAVTSKNRIYSEIQS